MTWKRHCRRIISPNFGTLAASSSLTALLGFCVGPGRWLLFTGSNSVPDATSLSESALIAFIWLLTFGYAAHGFGYRALSLLVAAPFVLFWPVMFGITTARWYFG